MAVLSSRCRCRARIVGLLADHMQRKKKIQKDSPDEDDLDEPKAVGDRRIRDAEERSERTDYSPFGSSPAPATILDMGGSFTSFRLRRDKSIC